LTLYEPHCFDFYVDTTQPSPVIGLTINDLVTIPMSIQTASDIGALLLAHAQQVNYFMMRGIE
jgi:hypothetical protein